MATNNSAVLEVITVKNDISSLLQDPEDYDKSSICSGPTYVNSNSLDHSPSIESFSAIHDTGGNLTELNIGDNTDMCIKVDSPQKHLETLETYITFRIVTKVARIEFDENEYIVRRRYNDFIWLRQKLLECHPFCIVPPLPGKHSLMGQLDRYSKDFILLRMTALNVFLTRIAQHPILSCNEHFKAFITAKQPDFVLHRKQRSPVHDNIKSLGQSNPSHGLLRVRDLEFDKAKTYLTSLSEKLTSIEKISSRIGKERSDLASELRNHLQPAMVTWAGGEPRGLEEALHPICVVLERCGGAEEVLAAAEGGDRVAALGDVLALVEAVKGALKRRDSCQAAYEQSVGELNRRHLEKDKLVSSNQQTGSSTVSASGSFSLWRGTNSEERLERLVNCIPDLLLKTEQRQDGLECANEQLRSDLQRWHQDKQRTLKRILLEVAQAQIDYYQASVEAWEEAVGDLGPPTTVDGDAK